MRKGIVERALLFAKKSHRGQKLVTGKDYIEHPIKVAELLAEWKQDEEVISAGLLHDVIEDCNTKLSEIRKKFGKRVARLVDGMSWIRMSKKEGYKKDWDKTYKKFSEILKEDASLILIKTADIVSNLPNIHVISHREFVIMKSYPRNMIYYVPLIESVGLTKIGKKIRKEFYKYTKKKVKPVIYDYFTKKEIIEIRQKLKIMANLGNIAKIG